jgi:hypothetical protein
MEIETKKPFNAIFEQLNKIDPFRFIDKNQEDILKLLVEKIVDANSQLQKTDIRFIRGAEQIDLKIKDGVVVFYKRAGSALSYCLYSSLAPEEMKEPSLSQYHWTNGTTSNRLHKEIAAIAFTALASSAITALAIEGYETGLPSSAINWTYETAGSVLSTVGSIPGAIFSTAISAAISTPGIIILSALGGSLATIYACCRAIDPLFR